MSRRVPAVPFGKANISLVVVDRARFVVAFRLSTTPAAVKRRENHTIDNATECSWPTCDTGTLVRQIFGGAQWCYVTPFALTKGDEFRSPSNPACSNITRPNINSR